MLATLAAAVTAVVFGHSVEGRPLTYTQLGDGPVRLLVVGSIHGDEPEGLRVVRAIRGSRPQLSVFLVATANPDGLARRTRWNARGVDLNRNFPRRWRPAPRGRYWPGPRAASEPETRAVMRLVDRLRPHLTIWYHQPYGFVDRLRGGDVRLMRAYAGRAGLRMGWLPPYRGTAASWQVARGQEAFVVELGPGRAPALRHARAALDVAERLAPDGVPPAPTAAPAPAATTAAAAPKPRIRRRPIPFPASRRQATRRYGARHYGSPFLRLEPQQIVEHVTAGGTLRSTWNGFAADVPDPELHERPGLCAHFVIDRDGTIEQLVPLRYRCRHAIGLNHVALGIEHVARTDAELMANRRQLAASRRLTRWLMARFAIARRDVIGHAESTGSRLYRERVARLRGRTHGDMAPVTMRRYRAGL